MEHLLGPRTRQKSWHKGPFLADLMANLVTLLGAISAWIITVFLSAKALKYFIGALKRK